MGCHVQKAKDVRLSDHDVMAFDLCGMSGALGRFLIECHNRFRFTDASTCRNKNRSSYVWLVAYKAGG